MPKYSDYREYEMYREKICEANYKKYKAGIPTYESDAPLSYSMWLIREESAVVKGELK